MIESKLYGLTCERARINGAQTLRKIVIENRPNYDEVELDAEEHLVLCREELCVEGGQLVNTMNLSNWDELDPRSGARLLFIRDIENWESNIASKILKGHEDKDF